LTRGRLGVVFGAGGDRDRKKRPIMGRIAAELADRVWLTSDNPRSEDPGAIIGEISVGVAPDPPGGYTSHPDRREAIRDALGRGPGGRALRERGKGPRAPQDQRGAGSPLRRPPGSPRHPRRQLPPRPRFGAPSGRRGPPGGRTAGVSVPTVSIADLVRGTQGA